MDRLSTGQIEYRRRFLVAGLPKPITAADSHLQIFDNYIENTFIRLRSVREPETKKWSRAIEKRTPLEDGEVSVTEWYALPLSEAEYPAFIPFKGREIRKNRYVYQISGKEISIDIYLGRLLGLSVATAYFDTREKAAGFREPGESLIDVSGNEFFRGDKLVDHSYADVREVCGGLLNRD